MKKYKIMLGLLVITFIMSGCQGKKATGFEMNTTDFDVYTEIASLIPKAINHTITEDDIKLLDSKSGDGVNIYTKASNIIRVSDSKDGFIVLDTIIADEIQRINDTMQQVDGALTDEELEQLALEEMKPGYIPPELREETDGEQASTEGQDSSSYVEYYTLENIELDTRIIKKGENLGVYRKDLYFSEGESLLKVGTDYIKLLAEDYPESVDEIANNKSYDLELVEYNYYETGLFVFNFVTKKVEAPDYTSTTEEIEDDTIIDRYTLEVSMQLDETGKIKKCDLNFNIVT